MTHWRSIWETPSDLGVNMTMVGLMALALALILNHLVSGLFRIPGDHPLLLILAAYLYNAVHWAVWLIGSALVCVGLFRIIAIDISRY